METVKVTKAETDRIASFLLDKKIVCFPTETVFGIAVIANDYAAYLRLVECKNRPLNKAFPLLVSSVEDIEKYVVVDARSKRIIQAFLPGPLTIVLPKRLEVPAYLSAGQDSIAIRFSDDPFVLELMQKVKEPIFLTSANLAGEPPCKNAEETFQVFQDKVACIVQGEPKSQLATTIVDLTGTSIKILRQGAITQEEIIQKGGYKMKIVIGSDHAGFEMKEAVKDYLKNHQYEVIDVGTYTCDSTDYPLYAIKAGEMVASHQADKGIVICGSGVGISIAANKVKGIRCALVTNEQIAKLSRQHNDANMLALPGRFITKEEALLCVQAFVTTAFEGGRHQKRIDIISAYENKK